MMTQDDVSLLPPAPPLEGGGRRHRHRRPNRSRRPRLESSAYATRRRTDWLSRRGGLATDLIRFARGGGDQDPDDEAEVVDGIDAALSVPEQPQPIPELDHVPSLEEEEEEDVEEEEEEDDPEEVEIYYGWIKHVSRHPAVDPALPMHAIIAEVRETVTDNPPLCTEYVNDLRALVEVVDFWEIPMTGHLFAMCMDTNRSMVEIREAFHGRDDTDAAEILELAENFRTATGTTLEDRMEAAIKATYPDVDNDMHDMFACIADLYIITHGEGYILDDEDEDSSESSSDDDDGSYGDNEEQDMSALDDIDKSMFSEGGGGGSDKEGAKRLQDAVIDGRVSGPHANVTTRDRDAHRSNMLKLGQGINARRVAERLRNAHHANAAKLGRAIENGQVATKRGSGGPEVAVGVGHGDDAVSRLERAAASGHVGARPGMGNVTGRTDDREANRNERLNVERVQNAADSGFLDVARRTNQP